MIDWITCTIPLTHKPIPCGVFLSISADGEIERSFDKKAVLRGSYESKIQVSSGGVLTKDGFATVLYADGNPSKFLQGHNIFGINDICVIFNKFIQKICSILSFPFPILNFDSIKIIRIDICESFSFRTRLEANQYIRQVSLLSSTRFGRPVMTGGTCYFGKNSRRWSIKYYSKGDEINKHKLPSDIPFRDELIGEADTLVRCELTLRSIELKRHDLAFLSNWTTDVLYSVYKRYLERINMSSKIRIESDILSSMPRCFRDTFFRWQSGVDVRSNMSKVTFHRHRNYLLGHGVDISVPNPDTTPESAEIIPLYKVLEPKPYQIPQWAYGTELLVS